MCKIENHINDCVCLVVLSILCVFGSLLSGRKSLKPLFLSTEKFSRNFPADSPDFSGFLRIPGNPPEVVSGSAAQTPPPHAPGARMT